MIETIKLLEEAIAVGNGEWKNTRYLDQVRGYDLVLTGDGAISAIVDVEVSNDDGATGLWFFTISLSGTSIAKDGTQKTSPWPKTRCVIKSISGTNAKLSSRVSAAGSH